MLKNGSNAKWDEFFGAFKQVWFCVEQKQSSQGKT